MLERCPFLESLHLYQIWPALDLTRNSEAKPLPQMKRLQSLYIGGPTVVLIDILTLLRETRVPNTRVIVEESDEASDHHVDAQHIESLMRAVSGSLSFPVDYIAILNDDISQDGAYVELALRLGQALPGQRTIAARNFKCVMSLSVEFRNIDVEGEAMAEPLLSHVPRDHVTALYLEHDFIDAFSGWVNLSWNSLRSVCSCFQALSTFVGSCRQELANGHFIHSIPALSHVVISRAQFETDELPMLGSFVERGLLKLKTVDFFSCHNTEEDAHRFWNKYKLSGVWSDKISDVMGDAEVPEFTNFMEISVCFLHKALGCWDAMLTTLYRIVSR
jgi:hypothetical protein